MKRLLAMIIALSIFFLSGCGILTKGVTVAETEEYTKITLDNFEGKKTISIPHDSPNEGALYYKTNITSGSIKAFYDLGILWDTENLFEATADNNSTGPGYYIDSSISKITIYFEADEPVSGEVIISFAPIEEHEHTYEWLTNETSHQKKYTCQCNTRDLTEFHSDNDENKICDICGYIMTGHQHTFIWSQGDIWHCYNYTCGCPTPPNAALHSDGDNDEKCDVCEYPMEEQEGK
ncbi:MAG: hypothetical protein E7453_09345 [Ruminococcaceae bacterium]|nr:hypothetical protein [Oscillospiraceae bacterium]